MKTVGTITEILNLFYKRIDDISIHTNWWILYLGSSSQRFMECYVGWSVYYYYGCYNYL